MMTQRHRSAALSLLLALLVAPNAIASTVPNAGTATARVTAESDAAIAAAIEDRLTAIPGLEGATVTVQGGIVRLDGYAIDAERREIAETLAARFEGVLLVENDLHIDTDIRSRGRPVLERVQDFGREFVHALPLLTVSALLLVGSWWFGGWLSRRRMIQRRLAERSFLSPLIGQAIRLGAVLLGTILALDLLNATSLVGALLGSLGIVGLAVGFALRDVAENYVAGVLLGTRQPFSRSDHVVIDGHEGRVAALTLRETVLITLDGNHLRLPNSLVFKGVTLNYSRNPTRRVSCFLHIHNWATIAAAQAAAITALRAMPHVLSEPSPSVFVQEIGPAVTVLNINVWIDQRQTDYFAASSETIRLTRRALLEAGIDMPDAVQALSLENVHALPYNRPVNEPSQPAERAGDLRPDPEIERHVDEEGRAHGRANLLDRG